MDPRLLNADADRLLPLLDLCGEDASSADGTPDGADRPRIPGYDILSELGAGGGGTVWRAYQAGTRRTVALKVLRAAGSRKARVRFEREVDLAARLNHPNLACIYDSGIHSGQFYYAMELIEGPPLDLYVETKQLDARSILCLMLKVCRAVEHAHQRGVIHRDLKPANILVSAVDDQPRVVDFGLAKSIDAADGPAITQQGVVAGTPAFMAPEQAAGRSDLTDSRADVYSLGVILYLLLLRRLPHEPSDSPTETARRIESGEITRPRRIDPTMTGDLEAVLLKALEREPDRRYPSAGALADDIDHFLHADPVSARPPTLLYFASKRLRKRWPLVASVAAVIVAVIASTVVAYVRVRIERNAAVAAKADSDASRATAVNHQMLAEAQRGIAETQRKLAESRLADSLLAQADAMVAADRITDAKRLYSRAGDSLDALGMSRRPAEMGLTKLYAHSPPPLNRFIGHRGRVPQAVMSPDHRRIVSAGYDGTVRLWDAVTGVEIRRFVGQTREVSCVAWFPDGKRIAAGGKDQSLRVWEVETGRPLYTVKHTDEVYAVTVSRDGRTLASSGWDQKVRLWDADSGRPLHAFTPALSGHSILCVAVSRDGTLGISGSDCGRAAVWDTRSSETVAQLDKLAGTATAVALSPDAKYAVVGSTVLYGQNELSTVVFEVNGGRFVRSLIGHNGEVNRVAYTDDGTRILTAGTDGTIRVWDAGGAALRVIQGHDRPLADVTFSEDGRFAISGGEDGVIELRSMVEETFDQSVLYQHNTPSAAAVAVSADGNTIAFGWDVVPLQAWNVPHRRLLWTRPDLKDATVFSLSSDGSLLLSNSRPQVRNGQTGEPIATLVDGFGAIKATAISPDGRALMLQGHEGVQLYRLPRQTPIFRLQGPATMAPGVSWMEGPDRIGSATTGGYPAVWDATTGVRLNPLSGLTNRRDVKATVAFPKRQGYFLAADHRHLVLRDAMSGADVAVLSTHTADITFLSCSADGQWAATAGNDHTLRIWDLPQRREACVISTGSAVPWNCALSGDGCVVAAGLSDGTVRIYDFDRPARYRELWPKVEQARATLGSRPTDPRAKAVLREWYSFRGVADWANRGLD